MPGRPKPYSAPSRAGAVHAADEDDGRELVALHQLVLGAEQLLAQGRDLRVVALLGDLVTELGRLEHG